MHQRARAAPSAATAMPATCEGPATGTAGIPARERSRAGTNTSRKPMKSAEYVSARATTARRVIAAATLIHDEERRARGRARPVGAGVVRHLVAHARGEDGLRPVVQLRDQLAREDEQRVP